MNIRYLTLKEQEERYQKLRKEFKKVTLQLGRMEPSDVELIGQDADEADEVLDHLNKECQSTLDTILQNDPSGEMGRIWFNDVEEMEKRKLAKKNAQEELKLKSKKEFYDDQKKIKMVASRTGTRLLPFESRWQPTVCHLPCCVREAAFLRCP